MQVKAIIENIKYTHPLMNGVIKSKGIFLMLHWYTEDRRNSTSNVFQEETRQIPKEIKNGMA